MSEFSSRQYLEIASCGASYSTVKRWSTECGSADFWPVGDLHPPQARLLMNAVLAHVASRADVQPGELELFCRASASKRIPGYTDVHVALLYSGTDARPDFAERLRSLAARHLAALCRPERSPKSPSVAPPFLRAEEQPTTIESLDEFPGARLLGIRIPRELTALIPGRPPLKFVEQFERAPRFNTVSTTFDVRGHVGSTKTHGKFRSIGVHGARVDASRATFSQPRVEFDEHLRKGIGDAFGHPTRRLVMTVQQTTTPRSTAKPLVTYRLLSLRFEAPDPTNTFAVAL